MHKVEQEFRRQEEKNPSSSSFINFSKALGKTKLEPETLKQLFNKLVDKEDYDRRNKDNLLEWLSSR